MRELTVRELDLISGGYDEGEDIYVTGSPFPYYPPSWGPGTPPTPGTGTGTGGGDTPPGPNPPPGGPVTVSSVITLELDSGEYPGPAIDAIGNIFTATLNVRSLLDNTIDGLVYQIPASLGLGQQVASDAMSAAAENINFRIVKDDGIDNGGVGSTQGTFADPEFVLENDSASPNGSGLLGWGQSLAVAEAYVLHELVHLTPPAQEFYAREFQQWSAANPGRPTNEFNNTPGWNRVEAFAWSLARDTMTAGGREWTFTPAQGFLW